MLSHLEEQCCPASRYQQKDWPTTLDRAQCTGRFGQCMDRATIDRSNDVADDELRVVRGAVWNDFQHSHATASREHPSQITCPRLHSVAQRQKRSGARSQRPSLQLTRRQNTDLGDNRISRIDTGKMIKRRGLLAGIREEISPHSFRGTGITLNRERGDSLEETRH